MLICVLRAASPADLIRFDPAGWSLISWGLLLAGSGLRLWAAGNLNKNSFTRPSGPYALVRHPLYLGTILVSLSFFLALGMPVTGLVLWAGLVAGVFIPVLAKEERELRSWFPKPYGKYVRAVPRLLPDPRALASAVRSSRFRFDRARRNYGLRALSFLVVVPLLVSVLRWIQTRIA